LRTATLVIAGQTFTIEQAGAGGSCGVQTLTPNVPVSGALTQGDCRPQTRQQFNGFIFADRYRFTATAEQQVRLLARPAHDAGSVFFTLSLSDANGNLITQVNSPGGFSGVVSETALPDRGYFLLPNAGTYFVEIASGSLFSYSLTGSFTQAGCNFGLAPARRLVSGTGNPTDSFNVFAGPGCTWTVNSNASWLTLNGANSNGLALGTGNGTLSFRAADNSTTNLRVGTITLGDQTVTVEQGGSNGSCLPVTITPGQTINGEIRTSDCFVSNGSNPPLRRGNQYRFTGRAGDRLQITVTAGDDSLRPVLSLFAPNEALLMRTDNSTVLSFTREFRLPSRGFFTLPSSGVYQLEVDSFNNGRYAITVTTQSACTFAATPLTYAVEADGGTREVMVQTLADCDWAVTSNVPWITTTARGAGNGPARFTVAPNPNATSRTGTVSLGSSVVTVTQLARTAIASAASYATNEFAPGAIATAFGQNLATATAIARTNPLPTQLANTIVRVRDSSNVTRDAPLFAVSPGQINFLLPTETALGKATVLVFNNNLIVATSDLTIVALAPGLFAANADGQGPPAGVVLRVRNELQIYEPLTRFDQATNRNVAIPIDLGPAGDDVFLILFGTGFRTRAPNGLATATLGGATAEVFYAGPQGGFAGLDQLNLRVPRSLVGRGLTNLAVTIEGKSLNVLQVTLR
jgi:uncharacterized protein (TIGR03437 family)